MRSTAIWLGALFVSGLPVMAANSDSWTAQPPLAIATGKHEAIPTASVFEVVTSMRGNAEAELQKKPFIPLSDAQARKFTGAYFSCPKGKRPFLVRALYGFAGTGAFQVYRIGREIWISHESLGTDFVSSRSALVVNLDFEPLAAYVSVSIIE